MVYCLSLKTLPFHMPMTKHELKKTFNELFRLGEEPADIVLLLDDGENTAFLEKVASRYPSQALRKRFLPHHDVLIAAFLLLTVVWSVFILLTGHNLFFNEIHRRDMVIQSITSFLQTYNIMMIGLLIVNFLLYLAMIVHFHRSRRELYLITAGLSFVLISSVIGIAATGVGQFDGWGIISLVGFLITGALSIFLRRRLFPAKKRRSKKKA